MRDGLPPSHEYSIRPTIADLAKDAQILKLVEIVKNKASESPYTLASLLSALKAMLVNPYFPKTIFGSGKTVAFIYKGQNYIVEFVNCAKSLPEEHAPIDSDNEMEVDKTSNTNSKGQNMSHSTFPPPELIKPSISDIITDDQFILLAKVINEKVKESPRKLATILAAIRAVLDDIGLKGCFFQNNKVKFFHGDESSASPLREYVVEFDLDPQAHQQQQSPHLQHQASHSSNNNNTTGTNASPTSNSNQRLPFVIHPGLTGNSISNNTNGNGFDGSIYNISHDADEDMDELAKDEIPVDDHSINSDSMWRHAQINLQQSHHPHHNTLTPLNKRKRASSANSEEDNFIHHTAPNAQSAKKRSPEKHKAPPLSCEAVKKLFVNITKPTLLQRLEESKTLIAAIKDTYQSIQQASSSSSVPSSPRLNLLCHLLQSPPTSRIDGISSKVFSNLELYKLFTTYNAYKDELGQKNHSTETNNSTVKRNSLANDPTSPLPYPTYSSFIDPTVTLHIKERTGGKEVGKHRLNCAWRLSILCELLGQGVLLMTKELSGAKLERILVEEFTKLIEFLKNPDNHDWVTSVREKLDLVGFDEVYSPLAEIELENSNTNGVLYGQMMRVEAVPEFLEQSVHPQQTNPNEIALTTEMEIIVPYDRPEDQMAKSFVKCVFYANTYETWVTHRYRYNEKCIFDTRVGGFNNRLTKLLDSSCIKYLKLPNNIMSRQRLTKDSTTPPKPTPSDTITLYFTRDIKFEVNKSRIIYEKLPVFIEERLRYINTFNYPYEVIYDDRFGKEQVIKSGEQGDEMVKRIKDLLESEEGKYVKDLYFLVDKSGGIKIWLYYNVDFIAFIITVICLIGVIFSTRFEAKVALHVSGTYLVYRMFKHVELPGLPNFVKKYFKKNQE
ncbi:10626_t:CDS:2 [Ambispora leptoticha]|uniref:10626_t:CDS:1 n=1 Tax=Ambispora leptoticha TaxID=144679 RepID=A0A9N8VEN4_9GLOM|nr:10626_t:CDS:2 [Ambispora leptoticha]